MKIEIHNRFSIGDTVFMLSTELSQDSGRYIPAVMTGNINYIPLTVSADEITYSYHVFTSYGTAFCAEESEVYATKEEAYSAAVDYVAWLDHERGIR